MAQMLRGIAVRMNIDKRNFYPGLQGELFLQLPVLSAEGIVAVWRSAVLLWQKWDQSVYAWGFGRGWEAEKRRLLQ